MAVQLVSCGVFAARTCSGLHAAFLCNCHLAYYLASSPVVLLAVIAI